MDCINPMPILVHDSRSFIFKLHENCFGDILRVQMCLMGRAADFINTVARFSLYTQVENNITLTSGKYNVHNNDDTDTCSQISESNIVCCFNITLDSPIQYSNNSLIGIELRGTLRVVQSNISSNVIICPFTEQTISASRCDSVDSFLLLFRTEIGKSCIITLISSLFCHEHDIYQNRNYKFE